MTFTTSCDFSFHVSRDLSAVVVTVLGELDVLGSVRLGAVLGDLIDGQGNMNVVVDLSRTTSVDLAGLGVFAAAAKLAKRHGGQLTLSGASDDVYEAIAGHAPLSMRMRRQAAHADATSEPHRHPHRHMVEFYENDEFLGQSVRDYMEPALLHGDAVVVVATEEHRQLFEAALTAAGVPVDEARAADRYIDVDAEDTLSTFMNGNVPDPLLFEVAVTKLIARAAGGGRAVRIYGEMVAILWDEGNVTGAIALEDQWNELGRSQPFTLFCAYPLTAFDRPETAGLFRRICDQHSTVVPAAR